MGSNKEKKPFITDSYDKKKKMRYIKIAPK